MEERRRFLRVLGSSALSVGAAWVGAACGADTSSSGTSPRESEEPGSEDTGGEEETDDAPSDGAEEGENGGENGGAAGGAGTGGTAGTSGSTGTGGSSARPAGTAVGRVEDFAANGLHQVSGTSVLVGRDAGGLYALSSICTHRRCNMNRDGRAVGTGIECTCHGSRFDAQGKVTRGPATRALAAYEVVVASDGTVYVNMSRTVSPSTRVPV